MRWSKRLTLLEARATREPSTLSWQCWDQGISSKRLFTADRLSWGRADEGPRTGVMLAAATRASH